MQYIKLLPFFLFLTNYFLIAQEDENQKNKIKYEPYGYVSYEAYFDTYESKTSRNGELYFYPLKPDIHPVTGEDLNENFQLNMLTLQSRAGVRIFGNDFLNAKTSALLEADFIGTAEDYKLMFSLRHAWFSLKWEKATLLMGQYWHPLFTPECFPSSISFGAAPAYNPLNRSPQIRYDFQFNSAIKFVAAFSEHSGHKSVGPEKSQVNAGVPDIQVQSHFSFGKILFGIGGGYFQLQPREGADKYKNKEKVHSFDAIVFGKAEFKRFSFKLKSLIGQNLTYLCLPGGFGRILDDQNNNTSFKYTSLITNANWIDCDYSVTNKIKIGLFCGTTINLGALEKIQKENNPYFYDRDSDISYTLRVAPRIVYKIEKLEFALEYSHDRAAYTEEFDCFYKPKTDNLKTGINHRILFSAKYFF